MKVLVFGLGLNGGGVGSALYFAKKGDEVRVTDLRSKEILAPSLEALKDFKIDYILGEHKFEDFDWADLIIKNPAIKPGNQFLEYALKKGSRVEMDMGIFLEHIKPEQIVGVTGTKGKSTTSSLIYEVLKFFHDDILFAGNIGKSVLDTIPHIKKDTLVVLELSSFQLEAFEKHQVSPKYAVITNIYPDHLNYYGTMEKYIASKRTICRYQTSKDFLVLRKGDLNIDRSDFLNGLAGKITKFSSSDLPLTFEPTLPGEHNRENMAAALAMTKIFNIPEDSALEIMSKFKGVPFRQELVKEWQGVKIINDTASTGPDAGIQALKTFPNAILIAGGMNKNMPYVEYAKVADEKAKKIFFLEGDSTEEIKSLMSEKDKIKGTFNNLEELLEEVKKAIRPGDTILFSPAATSFNLFQNEFDRGRKFNAAVEKVFS